MRKTSRTANVLPDNPQNKEALEGMITLREKVHLETKYFLLHVSENVKKMKKKT